MGLSGNPKHTIRTEAHQALGAISCYLNILCISEKGGRRNAILFYRVTQMVKRQLRLRKPNESIQTPDHNS